MHYPPNDSRRSSWLGLLFGFAIAESWRGTSNPLFECNKGWKQPALVLDNLQAVDYLFAAIHLCRQRSNVGLLLGGLDFAGQVNNPIVGIDSHTRQGEKSLCIDVK